MQCQEFEGKKKIFFGLPPFDYSIIGKTFFSQHDRATLEVVLMEGYIQ